MYKKVARRPSAIKAPRVESIFSVSACISEDFGDWVSHWRHNGFWLFDSLTIIAEIAANDGVDLRPMTPFFYRVYPYQWDGNSNWLAIEPDPAFETAVLDPGPSARPVGFDVVTYSAGNAAECSPLSCNHYAETIEVNRYCLFDRFQDAKAAVETGTFGGGEPGPHRILEVSVCDT